MSAIASQPARDAQGRHVWAGQVMQPSVSATLDVDAITHAVLPLGIHAVQRKWSEDRRAWRERAQRLATVAHLRNRFDSPPKGAAYDVTIIRVGGRMLSRASLMLCMRGVVAGVCEWLEIDAADPLLERRVRQRDAIASTMSVEVMIEVVR